MRRAPRPGLRWRVKEALHAVAGAAGLALAAPLALLLLPFYVVVLRLHERVDSAPHIRPSPEPASVSRHSRTSASRTNSARSGTSSPALFGD